MCHYRLRTDFEDYYDCTDELANVIYNRYNGSRVNRGKALAKLRGYGINTIELKQVSKAMGWDKVVVYKNPDSHSFKDKTVMNIEDAYDKYANLLCSRFIETDFNIKYIQIGNIGYKLILDVESSDDIKLKGIKSIERVESTYTTVGLPIYSMNYVVDRDNTMVATDFNEVQELRTLGFENILASSEINDIIYKSLIAYNKQAR